MRDGDVVAATFRDVYGQAVATLVRVFGDIGLAEDAVQDAFAVAAERWPNDGLPANPAGWIVTTARNRAIDVVRRDARGAELIVAMPSPEPADQPEPLVVPDDQLRLIFTCCHPALRREHQVALTLRLLGGLEVDEIARSFLVGEAAMAKRLTRAKYKIKAAEIPYRIPEDHELPDRLPPVLAVLYLIYNAGYDADDRPALRADAIRMARVLSSLMPDEPEVSGLLALMLLIESRAAARRVNGRNVTLEKQDRAQWDRGLIAEGHQIVRACLRRNQPGPYQLQASIQAVHCDARSFAETDWSQILELYDHLYELLPTAVVALNRAIARGEVDGPGAVLRELDELALDGYYLLHAARAHAYQRLGSVEDAKRELERAIELAPSEATRTSMEDELRLVTG